MKQETIERLLAKREAGTLTKEEQDLLNKLTRRDEVMAGAERRANAIVGRRRRALAACVATCIMGVAVGLIFNQKQEPVPEIAQQVTPVAPEEIPEEENIMAPVETAPMQTAAVSAEKAVKQTRKKHAVKPDTQDPVVMCNSQCDADSVISDIWKFLTA